MLDLSHPAYSKRVRARGSAFFAKGLQVSLPFACALILLGGCTVDVRGKKRPLVQQERISGEFETVVEHRSDEQGADVNRRESETLVFEERVRVKTQGDVYHPDLLTYDLGLGIGLVGWLRRRTVPSTDSSAGKRTVRRAVLPRPPR